MAQAQVSAFASNPNGFSPARAMAIATFCLWVANFHHGFPFICACLPGTPTKSAPHVGTLSGRRAPDCLRHPGVASLFRSMDSPAPPPDDHHFRRGDRSPHWRRIADHLSDHPADLSIALENIQRWLALGRVHPVPLIEWRERIEKARHSDDAFRDLIDFLAAPNHDAEPLKSCSPFAGLPLAAPAG